MKRTSIGQMLAVFLSATLCSSVLWAGFDQRSDVAAWLEKNPDLGFSKTEVVHFLSHTKALPSIIPVLNNAPERKLVWSQYGQRMVTESRITLGKKFLAQNAALIQSISQQTGVDGAIIAAIAGIESNYGNNMGKYFTLQVLATLAFDYPRRQSFFQRQLAEFFRLSYAQGLEPEKVMGSSAGAVGMGQFIPTSYRDFAIDGDGDGRADLFNSKADNIASIANYLALHGWLAGHPWLLQIEGDVEPAWVSLKAKRKGLSLSQWRTRGLVFEPVSSAEASAAEGFNLYAFSTATEPQYRLAGANFYAITRYNHSLWYSRAVVEIAQGIRL